MMSSGGYASIGDDNNGTNEDDAVVSSADHIALKFKESNLQTFRPPSDADDTFSKPVRGSSDEPQQSGWMHAFTI